MSKPDLAQSKPAQLRPVTKVRKLSTGCAWFFPIACVTTIAAAVTIGPWFGQASYFARVGLPLQPPDSMHWLGTDELGRDELVRLLYAGRISLAVGVSAALMAALVGATVGLVAGYSGGWLDGLLMRLTDVFLAVPALPLLLILAALDLEKILTNLQSFVGSKTLDIPTLAHAPSIQAARLIGVLAMFSWMATARLVRAQTLSLREADFIMAARAMGVGPFRICFRHLLPHCLAPVLVATATAISGNILYEAVLGFLGLGLPPPVPTWGSMLETARAFSYYRAPWLMYFPGLCISVTVLCVQVLADQLQFASDIRKSPGT